MHARRALLESLASLNGWHEGRDGRESPPDAFVGDTCVETRNTIYRLRDGVCFGVTSRDHAGRGRRSALVGMCIVGWLMPGTPGGLRPRITRRWEQGACAVLFRPSASGEGDGAMALTSPSLEFTHGLESTRLQAFHDAAPPSDSALVRRDAGWPTSPPSYVPVAQTPRLPQSAPPRRRRLRSQSSSG